MPIKTERGRANDQKLAAAAAEARSELDAERIAEKMQHEAKIEELERAAAIRSAELAELAKAQGGRRFCKENVRNRNRLWKHNVRHRKRLWENNVRTRNRLWEAASASTT